MTFHTICNNKTILMLDNKWTFSLTKYKNFLIKKIAKL